MRGSAILRELRHLSHLPLRSETIYHLALNSDGAEPPSLNRLIAADPALALAALRLTPRSFRNGKPGIAQIARFLTRQAILDLVKSSQTIHLIGPPHPVVDRVWCHSVATAHAVRQLSRTRRYHHPQSAFLAGLLHNLGLLAMVAVSPDAVAELLDCNNGKNGVLAGEKSRFGATHTTIGNQLAQRWGLPCWIAEVARWHHQSRGGLPGELTDRELVEMIRDADDMIARTDFALRRSCANAANGRPTAGNVDGMLEACVVGAIRQSTTFLAKHPLHDSMHDTAEWARKTVELTTENSALHADLDWQSHAWDAFQQLPLEANPVDLTALIAETFRHAAGALGVLCYVRNSDGTAAEGNFCCDGLRSVACELQRGASKSHVEQVVTQLRETWQNRPYRVLDLEWRGEPLAHVLLWIDEYAPPPSQETMRAVERLCASWLHRAAHVADLEAQIESFEQALRNQAVEAESRLEQAKLAALAEMAAGAGHEFNNPLAVISGRAQLLLAEETDPRRRRSLETIMGQAQRIHRMIVDLMFFARPPAPECKPASIAELVERAIASVSRDAEQLKVSLTSNVPADLPLVNGDIGQLAAAVECILRNSLEATPENGAIQVVAEAADHSMLQLKISDTGHGISDEQRQHIFEPFYCGREAGRGLGMGLPKAWSIVQNHNGELSIDSSPVGAGTTVTMRLPALAADARTDAQQRACA